MKSEESRIPVKHEHEHAIPTVIHDPEQDMNLLERWLRHAMANPVQFWGGVAAIVAGLVAISLLTSSWQGRSAAADDAWLKLETAKTPTERVEIAKAFPNTPAERWALLQAANEFYGQGFSDLPANKDAALPTLKKALDLFQKVAEQSPKDTPAARAAALGVARTYEARNELEKAGEWYRKVAEAKEWANTPEAKEAGRLAALLKKPETANFYKELYAFKPPEATIPGGGSGLLNLGGPSLLGGPGSAIGGTSTGSGLTIPDPIVPPPPPVTAPSAEPSKAEPAPAIELKKDAPAPTPAPKADIPADPFTPATPKAEPAPAPKAEPAPAPKAELPGDPFTPPAEPKK